MSKKISFFNALIISMFLISLALCGCRAAGTELAVEETGVEQTVIENVALDEIEEIEEIEEGPAEVMPISVERVYEIVTGGEDYFILDVRNLDEYKEGHIEVAVLIPVSELEGKLNELPKDKPIITYCKAGGRSATAAEILVNNGFTEVYDMGGITEWIDSGYPIVAGE